MNALSSLWKKCRVPLGSPSVEATLTRLRRLGANLGSPEWPRGTLVPCGPLPPVRESYESISRESCPLLGRCRGAQGTQRGTEFFFPLLVAICEERRINSRQLSHLSAYCLTVLLHVRILVFLSAKSNCLGLLYFNTGNPKEREECTIMLFIVISLKMNALYAQAKLQFLL